MHGLLVTRGNTFRIHVDVSAHVCAMLTPGPQVVRAMTATEYHSVFAGSTGEKTELAAYLGTPMFRFHSNRNYQT